MADRQADAYKPSVETESGRLSRRRRMLIGLGILLGVAVACVAAIVIMLQRFEARNANFQPPMTVQERERLMPTDPVLDTAPKLDGLRYGNQTQPALDSFSPAVQQAGFNHELDDPAHDSLHANSSLQPAAQAH